MKLKTWLFLSVSILLIVGALAISTAFQARQDQLRDLEAECDQKLEQLREIQEQLDGAKERMDELETMLLNLRRTESIITRTAAPSRGGRQYTAATMPVTLPSGFSAAKFERAFKGTGLEGIGEALIQAEKEYGVNALVLAAICAHESGWGSSRLARKKGNLAGLGAYDGAEYSAGITFDSRTASVYFLARLLAEKYCPGGPFFGGSFDLEGIGVRYASDPAWSRKVAGCMRVIGGAGA